MSAFYHGITKSIIGAFGAIFSDVHIIRRYQDTVNGPAIQDIKVPIRYAPRMKWFQQILDSSRDKQTNITLPRMCFEIDGMNYDASRKKPRGSLIKCINENGLVHQVDVPAPWNLDISLYLVANNSEDILQMLLQILPQFNPDRTLQIKTLFHIIMNVPISLTGVSILDSYEGEYTSHRLVIYRLQFTCKALYYGLPIDGNVIYEVDMNFKTFKPDVLDSYHLKFDPMLGQIVVDSSCWGFDESGLSKPSYPYSPQVEIVLPQTGTRRIVL